MKKIFLITALLIADNSFCQTIPNAGFETWDTSGPFLAPAGWAASPGVFQSNQAHSGSWALQCTTDTFTNPMTSAFDTIVGTAYSGAATMGPPTPGRLNGFSLTTRPDSLTGFYKYHAVGPDSLQITVTISKWSTASNSRVELAAATFAAGVSDSIYQRFSVPIQYVSDSTPDTCVIQVFSANPQSSKHIGASVWVDDLAFANVTTAVASVGVRDMATIYPVPFSNTLTVNETGNETISNITLFNAMGQRVITTTDKNINTSMLPAGVYWLQLTSGDGRTTTKELVKN